MDARWVSDPLGPPLADLASTAAALQAIRERRFEPRPQRRRQLAGRIEPPPSQSRWRRRHRHDRPAQHVRGRQPLDPLGHQVGDRQQPAELQRPRPDPAPPLRRKPRSQTLSSPAGPLPRNGSAPASRRPQRVQTTASNRQDRPQAAQKRRHRSNLTDPRAKTTRPDPVGERAHAWRAECKFSAPAWCRGEIELCLRVFVWSRLVPP